ncbi:aspartate ammonia-lyase [Strigomonas culicis]|uniref:Aspartate ammonia-lyase n=2 Tax=Strigomonas culicis TaxID=28005 RepID=S9UJV6_9TRYP|nr:aspartate ammonia-lyase [Strigomonas culicis]EPY14971.1 aspartate ammonia-lyase [Strigomonas culicis]|eukprot:EPY14955.1 aspartate ammonia-lyase [Strigomonas culicis]
MTSSMDSVPTRTEHDLLGDRQIPVDAYYGINAQRAMDNFHISRTTINDFPHLIRGMVQVKKAAAMANRELRLLPKDIAEAIVKACDLILTEGRCMDQFPIDAFQGGAGTSVNMNANEVVANLALELMGHRKGEYKFCHPNDHVNLCQSTNDAYPSGIRLALYEDIVCLVDGMLVLETSFRNKAAEFRDILKMGRTQLQDAVPMTLGEEFAAFAHWIHQEIQNLTTSSLCLLEFNLGGTAIGTGLNAAPGYAQLVLQKLADNTGHKCLLAEDLIAATPDCGPFVTVHGAIKRFCIKLSKISNDLRLLSSGPRTGLAEIHLPEMQAGSSIMPAKVNPVIPEVVNQVCFKVSGNDMAIVMAAEAGQLQLNVMEPVIAECMFESIELLDNACRTLAEKCVDGITANTERCADYVHHSIGIVTYLCPQLGHHVCDEIGKECARTGKSVREVAAKMSAISQADLDAIFSDENLKHPEFNGERFS